MLVIDDIDDGRDASIVSVDGVMEEGEFVGHDNVKHFMVGNKFLFLQITGHG